MAALPTHVTLVAATPTTVTVDGRWPSLTLVNQTAGTVVYARGDGATPVVAGDQNWAVFPVPAEGTEVPTAIDAGGTTTTIKLISAGTPTVSIFYCDDDD